ncbi:DUF2306 domain-containing protein [Mucilaginibacter sp. CAU 1740]|uniref:DUF2306 domain-containing protein n=1 Tax=Mucilaginibacter sp. CAU 1740 TaxID=3140365 RepID=UPI00325B7AE6
MKYISLILRCFAFFWIFALSGSTLYSYVTSPRSSFFLQIKEAAVATGWYLPAFYAHVFGSSIILLAGFFQFTKIVYTNKPLHRALGKLYVFGVLFFAAPGAYIMTLFINRGTGVFISFLLQNTLWMVFTLAALLQVKGGNINGHIKMMNRSYALAFGAVTLRFYILMFKVFGNGVDFNNNYLIIAFLSWVPNLILVEILLRYRKPIQIN